METTFKISTVNIDYEIAYVIGIEKYDAFDLLYITRKIVNSIPIFIKEYNGIEIMDDMVYFRKKENCKNAIEWLESCILMDKLSK